MPIHLLYPQTEAGLQARQLWVCRGATFGNYAACIALFVRVFLTRRYWKACVVQTVIVLIATEQTVRWVYCSQLERCAWFPSYSMLYFACCIAMIVATASEVTFALEHVIVLLYVAVALMTVYEFDCSDRSRMHPALIDIANCAYWIRMYLSIAADWTFAVLLILGLVGKPHKERS